jgi:AcrR family transcriptional regulator
LATARAQFRSHGFRSVRVDDIVRELGMSKKTFYQHFENKEELVRTVVLGNFEVLEQSGVAIFESDLAVAQKVGQFFSLMLEQFSRVPLDAPRDLLRLYPSVLDELAARRRMLLERYQQVIEEGQRRGELGTSLPAPAITETIITIVEAVGHPSHLARTGLEHTEMIRLVQGIVYGILQQVPPNLDPQECERWT